MNKKIDSKKLRDDFVQAIIENQNPLNEVDNAEQNDLLHERMKDKDYCVKCDSYKDEVQDKLCPGCIKILLLAPCPSEKHGA